MKISHSGKVFGSRLMEMVGTLMGSIMEGRPVIWGWTGVFWVSWSHIVLTPPKIKIMAYKQFPGFSPTEEKYQNASKNKMLWDSLIFLLYKRILQTYVLSLLVATYLPHSTTDLDTRRAAEQSPHAPVWLLPPTSQAQCHAPSVWDSIVYSPLLNMSGLLSHHDFHLLFPLLDALSLSQAVFCLFFPWDTSWMPFSPQTLMAPSSSSPILKVLPLQPIPSHPAGLCSLIVFSARTEVLQGQAVCLTLFPTSMYWILTTLSLQCRGFLYQMLS